MNIGAWIHDYDGMPLDEQIVVAAANGLQSVRSYHVDYAQKMVPALKQTGMSLFADLWIDAEGLAGDWRSQLKLDELARYHAMGVPLAAICVGNELRQGGNRPDQKYFSARLAFGLANLIGAYRQWLEQHGFTTPLTYAMEGIVFDAQGRFLEWVWPLIDACDVISLNLYPMDHRAWFGDAAFEESRRFLHEPRTRNNRLVLFEAQLRRTLQELEAAGKPVMLSETGFPSAIGYEQQCERLLVPQSDNLRFAEVMYEFVGMIRRVDADFDGMIQALYFYEWRDNLYHHKIWNEEHSPIHIAFGLCDHLGVPKLDISRLVSLARGS